MHCDHEYLNFKGGKFSKSRGAAVDVSYFLSKYDPDALRFYLTATAPETRDTEFSWEDLVERNNLVPSASEGNELVATARLSSRRSLGQPEPTPERTRVHAELRLQALRRSGAGTRRAGRRGPRTPTEGRGRLRDGGRAVQRLQVPSCSFRPLRTGLGEALSLACEANVYTFVTLSAGLDRRAPWFQIKEDRQAAATTVYVILRAVDNLKTILAPILPHTAQQLHEYLGYEGQPFGFAQGRLFGTQHVVEYEEESRCHRALTYDHNGAVGTWAKSELPAGQALRQPAPLFKKLDESVSEEEYARLEG